MSYPSAILQDIIALGVPRIRNGSLVSGDGTLRLNSPRYPSQLQLGAQIVDWGTATASSGLGTTGTTTSFLRGSSQGYSITVTGAANGQNWRSKKPFWGGGIQLDLAANAATAYIQAYVDAVEAAGGIGQAFLHDFNHTDLGGGLYSDTATKDLCDYLVTKASTIDVVTPETIWQTMPYMQVD